MALTDKLTAIADAIRTKTGSTDLLTLDGMAEAIAGIPSGGGSIPIEISTDDEMAAVLTSENVGKVYKFIGTSNTYINGDLYIVEVG